MASAGTGGCVKNGWINYPRRLTCPDVLCTVPLRVSRIAFTSCWHVAVFTPLAQSDAPSARSGTFNYEIMELGAPVPVLYPEPFQLQVQ